MCYDLQVALLRLVLLFIFALISSQFVTEISDCPAFLVSVCTTSYTTLVPFVLCAYFCDSILLELSAQQDGKKRFKYFLLGTPYILGYFIVLYTFISSITLATFEKIFTLQLIFAALLGALIYLVNTSSKVREFNYYLMFTFIASLFIFGVI